MKRNQITITYPDACIQSLDRVLKLRQSSYINLSAFCRDAIEEKLERLETQEIS